MITRQIKVFSGAGLLALGFVALIVLMASLRPEVEKQVATPVAPIVYVKDVRYGSMNLAVRTQGEVRPRREIELSAQIAGRIASVSPSFAGGGVFRKGEVLITLEDADYRLAVTRARAQVAQSRQRLAVEEAEAALAARDYNELTGKDAEDDPSLLVLRQPQLDAAKADLAAAEANLGDAELALARTKVTAPFAGRVRSINADVGQYVTPGAPLGQIFSTDKAEIRLPLTDSDLAKLKLPFAFEAAGEDAPPVKLYADVAGQRREWTGRIRRVDAAVDARTRQIAAIAEVDDPYGAGADKGFPLAVGLFVNAEIKGPEIPKATVLPFLAVRGDGQVYVVDFEDRLTLRAPTIIAEAADGLVANGGIEEGARLVISPVTADVGAVVRPLYDGGKSASTLVDLESGGLPVSEFSKTGEAL